MEKNCHTSKFLKGVIISIFFLVILASIVGVYYQSKKSECQPTWNWTGYQKIRPDLSKTKFTTNGVFSTVLQNGAGTGINIYNIRVDNIRLGTSCSEKYAISNANYIKPGDTISFAAIDCLNDAPVKKGARYAINITIEYEPFMDAVMRHYQSGVITGCYE